MYCSYQVIIFQRAEIKAGNKKVNGERNRRASILLPINPLKMARINITWFGCIEAFWGKDRSKVYLVRFFCDAL